MKNHAKHGTARRAGSVVAAALVAATAFTTLSALAADEVPDDARGKEVRAVIDRTHPMSGVSQMRLSPDGSQAALIAWVANKDTPRDVGDRPSVQTLLLMDLATGKTRTLMAPERRPHWNGVFQATSMTWISDTELAVNTNFGQAVVYGTDGHQKRVLGRHLLRVIPGSDKEGRDPLGIVGTSEFLDSHAVHRLNLRTGVEEKVPVDLPDDVVDLVFDHHGRLRAAVTVETHWFKDGARRAVWYRHDEKSPWTKLEDGNVLSATWAPVEAMDDEDALIVRSRQGRDYWAMFRYDPVARRMGELMVSHPSQDILSVSEDSDAVIERVVTGGLKSTTTWFDPAWDAVQKAIDQALPDAVNTLSGPRDKAVLILSRSDRQPGRWLVLDRASKKLKTLSNVFLDFDVAHARPMEPLTYDAPDGMKIPAYLTLPEGPPRAWPLVVYVHGGPIARDHWGFDREVQTLAQAGYAVLQPQFRGSEGFGKRFEDAGLRQWGLAMQDDVTAGVQAMVARGVADPRRVCIYGASYGGYAALWGLVKTPELYKCGISFAGVSDIGELFTDWSDTNASKVGPEALRMHVGDVATMKPQFDTVSPEKHADLIRVPVLLGHGEDDARVKPGHTRRMASALKAANKEVEVRWYAGEGHGLAYVANVKDFDLAVLDFLDRHIGPRSPMGDRWNAPAAAPAASAP